MRKLKQWGEKYGVISLIILAGFVLRIIGVQFGKPFRYHPDELKLVYQAGNLLQIHHWSKQLIFLIGVYPPFFTYILAALFAVYSGLLIVLGYAPNLAAVKEMYYMHPFTYHLIARWVSVVAGTMSIGVIYLIGKKLYSRKTAMLAAAFVAGSFILVRNSHFGVVDIFQTLLVLISFYFTVQIFHSGNWKDYAFAGIFAGLAAATKWNAGLIVLPIIVAHFFVVLQKEDRFWRKIISPNLLLAGTACLAAFLIACPMPLLDFKEFWGGIVGTAAFQQSGAKKLGAGGNFWSYFTGHHSPGYGFFYDNSFVPAMGLFATIAFSLGIFYLLWRHRRQDVLLLSFPIVIYLLIGQMNYKAMRQLLPVVPFLLLIASEFIVQMSELTQRLKIQRIILVLAGALIVVPTGVKALRYDIALCQPDTRTLMKNWIEANIPANTKIGMEEFHPPLLSRQDLNLKLIEKSKDYKAVYDIFGLVPGMFAHGKQRTQDQNPVGYILENKIEYIVLDSFTYDRYHWKLTRQKNAKIVAERDGFYHWVAKECVLVHAERPQNHFNISPGLKIYKVKTVNS